MLYCPKGILPYFFKKRCNESTLTLRWVNFTPVYNPRLCLLASPIFCMCNNSVSPHFASKPTAQSEEEEEKAAEKCQQVQKAAVAAKKVSRSWNACFPSFSKYTHMIYRYMFWYSHVPSFWTFFCARDLENSNRFKYNDREVQRQHISISFSLACCNRYMPCSCLSSPRRRCGEVLYTSSSQGRLLSTHSPFPPAYPPPLSLSRDCSRVWRGFYLLANVFTYFWNGMTPILERHLNAVTALWWLFLVYSAGAEWFCDSRGFMIGRLH